MHEECGAYVARQGGLKPKTVLDVGGAFINGHVRWVAPDAEWTCLDIKAGPGVDIVANAATWKPPKQYDLVLCLEVFEHSSEWALIVHTLAEATKPGGTCVITCAIDPRPPHGAYGGDLMPDEYYGNVDPVLLYEAVSFEFAVTDFTLLPRGDAQITARR